MLPALIGISGHEVGAEEEAAIRRWQPAGFILFSRNIDSVEQVRGLTISQYGVATLIDRRAGF